MTDVDQIRRALEYVAALEIPHDDDPGLFVEEPMVPTGDNEEGSVDAGSLVVFVSGVSPTHKEDVLNSTLLAQLAANKLYDREEQTREWYDKYHEVLENIGWVVSGFDFTKYKASGSELEIEKVVLEILATIATGPQIAAAIAVMNALKGVASGSKSFKLWDEQTNNGSKGNFQIASCIEDGGNVAMGLGAFHFQAVQVDFQFLWFKYSSNTTEIYQGAQQVVLNEQVYSKVRQSIITKLGNKAVDYVSRIDI